MDCDFGRRFGTAERSDPSPSSGPGGCDGRGVVRTCRLNPGLHPGLACAVRLHAAIGPLPPSEPARLRRGGGAPTPTALLSSAISVALPPKRVRTSTFSRRILDPSRLNHRIWPRADKARAISSPDSAAPPRSTHCCLRPRRFSTRIHLIDSLKDSGRGQGGVTAWQHARRIPERSALQKS